jgi:hypothetical protein
MKVKITIIVDSEDSDRIPWALGLALSALDKSESSIGPVAVTAAKMNLGIIGL